MNKVFIGFLLVLATTLSYNATAQSAAEVVTHSWTGYSSQEIGGNAIYYKQSFNFRLNSSDNSLSGTAYTSISIDGTEYSSKYSLTGKLYESDNTLYYNASYVSGDQLPNSMDWCGSSGTLEFYTDPKNPGYYLLGGPIDISCGGSANMLLSDK